MTVKELIEKLSKLNQDAVVGTENDLDFYPIGECIQACEHAFGWAPKYSRQATDFENVVILETTTPQVYANED